MNLESIISMQCSRVRFIQIKNGMWHLTKGYNPHVVPDQSSPKAQILNTKQQGPQQVKTNHTLQKKIQRIKTVPDRKRKMQVARVGQGEEVKVAPKKKKYKNTKAQNTKAQTKQWNQAHLVRHTGRTKQF